MKILREKLFFHFNTASIIILKITSILSLSATEHTGVQVCTELASFLSFKKHSLSSIEACYIEKN